RDWSSDVCSSDLSAGNRCSDTSFHFHGFDGGYSVTGFNGGAFVNGDRYSTREWGRDVSRFGGICFLSLMDVRFHRAIANFHLPLLAIQRHHNGTHTLIVGF